MQSKAFEIIKQGEIPEIKAEGFWYRHRKSGAEIFSVVTEDENKVFAATFRTPPPDNSGVAHIVEHAVFCGSEKFPIKDPFKELLKGSLHTFLNAMTYPDKTCYPVASRNEKDFYHLVDVYLDTVFHPLLSRFAFHQEGWHIEWKEGKKEPIFNGIVFNEMKGAYSSPDSIAVEYAQQSLFPDTVYGLDSGGVPAEILNLTYENFKAFHREYYHPSNARIYFYGNDDPAYRLEILDDCLKRFDRMNVSSGISLQPRFKKPSVFHHPCMGLEKEGGFVLVNWLLSEATDLFAHMSQHMLAYLLVGSPASPLRKALLDSNLGDDMAGIGLEGQIRELYFSTGLKGVQAENYDHVKNLVFETLKILSLEGFNPDLIDSGLNSMEFGLRENNTGSSPRGLGSLLKSLVTWLYDQDPFQPLRWEPLMDDLRTRCLEQKDFFQNLIRKNFLENPHHTIVTVSPDKNLANLQKQKETEQLDKTIRHLNEEECKKIRTETSALHTFQETYESPEKISLLPRLELSDIDRKVQEFEKEIVWINNVETLLHTSATQGIFYLDLCFDLNAVPQRLIPMLLLFGRGLTEMGTQKTSYVDLAQEIGQKTGGIHAHLYTGQHFQNPDTTFLLFIRSKALQKKIPHLFSLLEEILTLPDFTDQVRFRQLLLEEKAEEESSIIPSGHNVIKSRLAAHFSKSGEISEAVSGVDYLFALRAMLQRVDQDWDSVLQDLQSLQRIVLCRNNLRCNITADNAENSTVLTALDKLFKALPKKESVSPENHTTQKYSKRECLLYTTPVNFVGQAYNLLSSGYTVHGAGLVGARLLRTSWLWDTVRVKGGAYGAFCSFNYRLGYVSFASYRDPNILLTMEAYKASGHFLQSEKISNEDIKRGVIGTLSDLDPCLLPDAQGYQSFLNHLSGIYLPDRQKIRDEVFETERKNLQNFAEAMEAGLKQSIWVILSAESGAKELEKYFNAEIVRTPVQVPL